MNDSYIYIDMPRSTCLSIRVSSHLIKRDGDYNCHILRLPWDSQAMCDRVELGVPVQMTHLVQFIRVESRKLPTLPTKAYNSPLAIFRDPRNHRDYLNQKYSQINP